MPEIYGLFDSRDGVIRYIGKANDSAKRLISHMRDARRRRTPVYDWINSVLRDGSTIAFKVLSVTDDWKYEEKRLIFEARLSGVKMLNVADGGDEPYCPLETRRANGRKSKGYVHQDPVQRLIWEVKMRYALILRNEYLKPEKRDRLKAIKHVVWQRPLDFAPTLLGQERCDAFSKDIENRLSQCPS